MIIALDFDGVIADGLNECLLVAWNVFYKRPLTSFNPDGLNEIPEEFKQTFRELRNYVRHDGHFLTSFYFPKNLEKNQYSFSEVFTAISISEITLFRENFANYRGKARECYTKYWSELHNQLIDIKEIIFYGCDVRIISGKDADSIAFILNSYGITLARQSVHGQMTNKEPILQKIKMEALAKGKTMIFVDDNLNNVIDSLNIGINSVWAKWGYHTVEHLQEAQQKKIKSIDKQQFLPLILSLKDY